MTKKYFGLFVPKKSHTIQHDKQEENVRLLILSAVLILSVIVLAMIYFGIYYDVSASEDITRPTVTSWTSDEVQITWYGLSRDRACDELSFGYVLFHSAESYWAENAWHVRCWRLNHEWAAKWSAEWSYPGGVVEIEYAEIGFGSYPNEVVVPDEFSQFPKGIVYIPLVTK